MLEEQKEIFSQILHRIKECPKIKSNERLTGFRAIKGHNAKGQGDLMVIGRALNGGGKGFLPQELDEKINVEQIADDIVRQNKLEPRWTTLRWVAEDWQKTEFELREEAQIKRSENFYNPRRSQFWRVIKDVVQSLKVTDTNGNNNWSSYLIWSNLYKISPFNGGNPSGRLMEVQREKCIELLKLEIETWKPKHILMLTGGDWSR